MDFFADFMPYIWFTLGVQFLAGFIKTVAGFGNGFISGSLLAMRFDVANITASNAVLDIPLNGYFALKFRKHYKIKKYIVYSLLIALGGITGAFLLKISPPKFLKIIAGVFVIGMGFKMLFVKDGNKDMNMWFKGLVLLGGGIIGGMFGMNILFIPIYKRMSGSYEEFKGSICFTYTLELILRAPIYFLTGTVSKSVLPLILVSAVGLVIGIVAGNIASKFVKQKLAEKIAVAVMFLGGISLIVKTLFF